MPQELLLHFAWIDAQIALWKQGLGYRDEVNKLKEKICAAKLALAASTGRLEAAVSEVIGHEHLRRF